MDLDENEPVEIEENPPFPMKIQKKVKYADTWSMRSMSINDEEAALVLTIGEPEGEGMEIENPTLIDLDTQFKITFEGKMRSGDTLKSINGKAELNGKDVSSKVSSTTHLTSITIPRKGANWRFEELASQKSGRFDHSIFDRDEFARDVPVAHLTFQWTARLLAAFDLKVPTSALERNGMSEEDLAELVNTVKAAGVKAMINGREISRIGE